MKFLLIFPPQWTPVSPHFAVPSLLGQLRSNGFDAEGLDLNIDFYNTILTKDFVSKSFIKALNSRDGLIKEISKVHRPDKQFSDYDEDMQNKILRYSEIKKYAANAKYYLDTVPYYVDSAREALKDSEQFYDASILIKSANVIDMALSLVSLPYAPTKLSIDNLYHPLFKLNYDSVKYYVKDKSTNMFYDYYESVLPLIDEKNADCYALSINSSSQMIPGLTLAYLLKKRSSKHINIGGNFFGRVAEELKKHKEFFEIFADTVSVEEGEGPIVDFAKYITGQIPAEEASNLIYLRDGEITATIKKPPLKLDEAANLDFTGYEFDKYFVPEITLSYQSSRGCYWGKCSFCDQDFGQNFNVKNVEKVISEMKELKEKYGIKYFEFIDESVGPAYMNTLSDRLIEENLDIAYFCDARLENAFTKETLKKAFKAGLRMVLWGVESGSDKIMELINKGIEVSRRPDILRDAKNAGIWNFAFIFFGFPAETKEDALKTVKMLCDNKDIINSYGRSVFTMGKHTKLKNSPEKYGITEIFPVEDDFSPTVEFSAEGMTKAELHEVIKTCTEECNKAYGNPLWMYLRYREWLFLYVNKFGAENVANYKVKL